MFDIGALELILVAVVALIVVGPERLPRVARTAGLWLGRARRSFMAVKEEIDRELRAEELKEILRKQAESNPLEQIIEVNPRAWPSAARPTPPAQTPVPPAQTPAPTQSVVEPAPPAKVATATPADDAARDATP